MAKEPSTICNLCGKTGKGVRERAQYPAMACGKCYRRWKRTANAPELLEDGGTQ